MSLDDEGTVEDEHLVDQTARMIPVLDDHRVDTEIKVFNLKVEFGTSTQPFTPIRVKLFLTANDTLGSLDDSKSRRRREDDVVTEVTQYGVEVVGVPRDQPIGCKHLRGCGVHWVNLDDVRGPPKGSNVRKYGAESTECRHVLVVLVGDRPLVVSQGEVYSGIRIVV